MKEILYTKFNSTRKPEYQVSTSIVLEDEKKYVEKKAIQQVAEAHLKTVSENKKKIDALYTQIKLIPNEYDQKVLSFPYITGKSLMNDIDFQNDSLDVIIQKIKMILYVITSYNEEFLCDFEMTDEFAEFFKDCVPKDEESTKVSNVDGILGNFVKAEDGTIWCIDYEWVLDFPVPVRYVVYRSLVYLYIDNNAMLAGQISLKNFLGKFGYSEEDIQLFEKMEESFQQYVHGKNREYIYVNQYQKKRVYFSDLQNAMTNLQAAQHELLLARNHADNLQMVVDEQRIAIENLQNTVEKYKKAVRNPIYAVKLFLNKTK